MSEVFEVVSVMHEALNQVCKGRYLPTSRKEKEIICQYCGKATPRFDADEIHEEWCPAEIAFNALIKAGHIAGQVLREESQEAPAGD